MKNKRNVTVILILFFCIILSVLGIVFIKNKNKESESESRDNKIVKILKEYADDYKVVEKGEDDSVKVSINAPDFKSIIDECMKDNEGKKVDIKEIEKAVENTDSFKEYTFWVDKNDRETIKQQYIDNIAEEVMVEAISNVKFEDRWDVE
jgi:competence protein ComGC